MDAVNLDGSMIRTNDELVATYSERLLRFGTTAKLMFYLDDLQHTKKLRAVASLVPVNQDGLIIDVGCGLGDLLSYIEIAPLNYVGVDLVPEFVTIAEARHPGYTFVVGDMELLRLKASNIVLAGVLSSVPSPKSLLSTTLLLSTSTVCFDVTIEGRLDQSFASLNRFDCDEVSDFCNQHGFAVEASVDLGSSWIAMRARRN